MPKPQKPTTIDGYISQFPADTQAILEKVRATIRRAAPEAKEIISYQMPTFKQPAYWSTLRRGRNTSGCIRRSPATRPLKKQSHVMLDRRAIYSFRSISRCLST
jgi:Domain of unknown function (DU1801)